MLDLSLKAIGYTEHSFAHVGKCVNTAAYILSELGYDEEEIEIPYPQMSVYVRENKVTAHWMGDSSDRSGR